MRTARGEDLPPITRLLAANGLPTDDLSAQDLSLFVVDELDGELSAVGGLERCGESALLRSVATAAALRGQGRARAVVAELEARAARDGIAELYLLTETAADFFNALGYAVRDRDTVPPAVRASQQFSSLCPASATVMAKATDQKQHGYEQTAALPREDEYRQLRVDCGLSPRSREAAESGLPRSLFCTTIRDRERLIAMARIVGDGGCNFEVVDVAVHPEYQKQGLGSRLMAAVTEYIRDNAPESAYVCLIADHHSPALYSKFGFEPTAPVSIGMAYTVKKEMS